MASKPPSSKTAGWKPRETRERERKRILDLKRGSPAERGYDAAWRRVRSAFLTKFRICCSPGCGRDAVEVDHIKSVRERPDLRLSWSNLRPFCKFHHSQRTARDQGFGRRPHG